MTRRRWIAENWSETNATLTGAQAEHLARVLRARPGMQADVVAGGRVFHAELSSIGDGKIDFKLLDEIAAEPALPVTLVMAVYKFDRMEWAIEKAVELGVRTIAPVLTERTEKHLAQSAGKRAERWRRIAHQAAQQSRRSDVPLVSDPVPLAGHLAANFPGMRLVLAEQESTTTLRFALDEWLSVPGEEIPPLEIAIGPEGGWTAAETELFIASGWHSVTLGPRILRAETAAIAALAIASSFLV